MRYSYIPSITYCLIGTMCLFSHAHADNQHVTNKCLREVPQGCTKFTTTPQYAHQPIASYNTEQVMNSFLKYYFAPWDNPFMFFSIDVLRTKQVENLKKQLNKPGCTLNRQPMSSGTVQAIGHNMHLDSFPNSQQPAIVVRLTHLSNIAAYIYPFTSGGDYPSDSWQASLLAPNEPVYVLHTSQDKAWCFVITSSYTYGWVPRADIAYTIAAFRKAWRASGQYMTPTQDMVRVARKLTAPLANVGQPLLHVPGVSMLRQCYPNNVPRYPILSIHPDKHGYAAIKMSFFDEKVMAQMPLLATPQNTVSLANCFMRQPYDWEGIEEYSDHSSLLKDICMRLDIWLSRDPGPQAEAGLAADFGSMTRVTKETTIMIRGVPFLTILYTPGHSALHRGAQANEAYSCSRFRHFKSKDTFEIPEELLPSSLGF